MKLFKFTIIVVLAISIFNCDKRKKDEKDKKPIIYLYSDKVMEVSVRFEDMDDVELTHTYPDYGDDGWRVITHPDGTLYDVETGIEYYALYWEGLTEPAGAYDTGFVVTGMDTADFLDDTLAQLGLTRREANEFIVYWLPILEENAYNFIHFSTAEWNDTVPLKISPEPDALLRLMMRYRPLEMPIDVEPQTLAAPSRGSFTVVEWGGSQI